MKLKALGKNVLLEYIFEDKKTVSGLIIDSKSQNTVTFSYKGKVLSMGKDVKKHAPTLKVGNKVMFKFPNRYEFTIGVKDYVIVDCKEITCILNS